MTEAKGSQEVEGQRVPEQRQYGRTESPEARGDLETRSLRDFGDDRQS